MEISLLCLLPFVHWLISKTGCLIASNPQNQSLGTEDKYLVKNITSPANTGAKTHILRLIGSPYSHPLYYNLSIHAVWANLLRQTTELCFAWFSNELQFSFLWTCPGCSIGSLATPSCTPDADNLLFLCPTFLLIFDHSFSSQPMRIQIQYHTLWLLSYNQSLHLLTPNGWASSRAEWVKTTLPLSSGQPGLASLQQGSPHHPTQASGPPNLLNPSSIPSSRSLLFPTALTTFT